LIHGEWYWIFKKPCIYNTRKFDSLRFLAIAAVFSKDWRPEFVQRQMDQVYNFGNPSKSHFSQFLLYIK